MAPTGMALLALVVLASIVLPAAAWGLDGHRLTCMIAEPLLTRDAKAAVEKLVQRGSFSDLCGWADNVKRSYRFRWSGPLHYIDTPDNLCGYKYERDCHNSQGEEDMCVAGAINNYTSQLESFDETYNLTESFLFLVHYMGDIHQPLHVAFTSDAGGNGIHVRWYGRRYNLHHVWDTEFITKAKSLYYHDIVNMAHNISRSITKEQANAWKSCEDKQSQPVCTDRYATESIRASCKWAYKDASNNSELDDDYFNSRLPVVIQRLAQGGVRLAAILNKLFAKHSATK